MSPPKRKSPAELAGTRGKSREDLGALQDAEAAMSELPQFISGFDGKEITRRKEIASTFRKYGDQFDRLDYVPGKAAIYHRESPGGHVQYEVWKLRLDKDDNEVSPSASQWGTCGWTYLTDERAVEKYRSLLQLAPSRGSEDSEEGGESEEDAPAVYGAISSNQEGGIADP